MYIKAKKQQMSQLFLESGRVIPVTLVKTENELTEDMVNKTIKIEGVSKGKGFAGVMKKWNFKGEMATRGQSDKPRQAGSIGSQTPGRVWKGKKMAGHLGTKKITLKSLRIVKIDAQKGEIFISGPLPGSRNSEIKIFI